jgi:hypothetical protein
MLTETSKPILPQAWMPVLDTIEHSLAEVVEQTAQRQEALPEAEAPSSSGNGEASWKVACAHLEKHLDRLEECVARARQCATEADSALAESIQELGRWLESAQKKPPVPGPENPCSNRES